MNASKFNLVSKIVHDVSQDTDLPEHWQDLDALTKARLERMAQEQNSSPATLWAAVRAQHEQARRDAADGFDPGAIARAARRGHTI